MVKQTGEADKKEFGHDGSPQTHVNHPFDAAEIGGHELNESYKVPAADSDNLHGGNPSYLSPVEIETENLPGSKRVVPEVSGKNPS